MYDKAVHLLANLQFPIASKNYCGPLKKKIETILKVTYDSVEWDKFGGNSTGSMLIQ